MEIPILVKPKNSIIPIFQHSIFLTKCEKEISDYKNKNQR